MDLSLLGSNKAGANAAKLVQWKVIAVDEVREMAQLARERRSAQAALRERSPPAWRSVS